jgi:hypothetical protein
MEKFEVKDIQFTNLFWFKIVNNLTPSFLSNLLTPTTQQRSGLLLRSACNFSLFQCCTEIFKSHLQDFFDISTYEKRYDYELDRHNSILHARLRLNCCALNYYLFKINCVISPACNCGFNCESVIHYFLYCPRYAALRIFLLVAMVEILGSGWYHMSDSSKNVFVWI